MEKIEGWEALPNISLESDLSLSYKLICFLKYFSNFLEGMDI